MRTKNPTDATPLTATAYGSGTALIVDEPALLVDLQDVYWARDGRRSVDAAIGLIAAGGIFLAVAPLAPSRSGMRAYLRGHRIRSTFNPSQRRNSSLDRFRSTARPSPTWCSPTRRSQESARWNTTRHHRPAGSGA